MPTSLPQTIGQSVGVPVSVIVNPRPVAAVLLAIAAVLAIAHLAMYFVVDVGGRTGLSWLQRLFHLDMENNIPTWFSSCLLLGAALLLFVIAAHEKSARSRYSRQWRFLAFVFVGLSIDEVASIHEILIQPLRTYFGASGFFYYTWVVAGIAFVILVALYCFRWFWQLPIRTRHFSGMAASVYLGGAVATEMLRGYLGANKIRGYIAYATLEETLEMIGVILWIYTLAEYAQHRLSLNLSFGRAAKRA